MMRIAVGVALAAAPRGAVADRPRHVAKVSIEQARELALVRVPGTIRTEELEREHRRWIYSFEIRPAGETRKIVKEVNVDAETGAIVSVETERDRSRPQAPRRSP